MNSRRFNFDCLQNSKVCYTGRYAQSAKRLISICANDDRVNLIVWVVFKGNIEVKQCICIGMRDLTSFLKRRNTAKQLIHRCSTFTNIGSGSALDLVTTACDTPLRV